MSEAIPVKHLNVKSAGVNPRDAVKNSANPNGKNVFMIRMYGVLQGVKSFEDKKSSEVKFVMLGEFVGKGPDGKTYVSDKMFCFRALEDKMRSSFDSGDQKAMEFGYDVTAVPDEKSSTGYSYQAVSVIKSQVSDRLATLAAQLDAEKPLPGSQDGTGAAASGNGVETSQTAPATAAPASTEAPKGKGKGGR